MESITRRNYNFFFPSAQQILSSYYAIANDICYCTNVDGLVKDLEYEHIPADWRLLIDSSKTSLKAVLLHNGNSKPAIPVDHSTSRKEKCNTMKVLLEQLNYPKYTWKICSDLKVVSLLLGLQLGYIKHMRFLCLWNSRHDSSHYAVKVWPPRENPCVGTYNVKHQCFCYVIASAHHTREKLNAFNTSSARFIAFIVIAC